MVDVLGTGCVDPNRLGVGDQRHQIEEVTALLDQGSAGVAVEPVPVPHLGEKREPVLADRDHLDVAGAAGADLARSVPAIGGLYRYSSPIQTMPWCRFRSLEDATALSDGRPQRLLDQHVDVGGEDVLHDVGVGVVR